MWIFQSTDFIRLISCQKFITFVGSGGKTSLMEYMAAELLKQGRTVAITTTTKIFVREPYLLMENLSQRTGRPFVRIGRSIEDGKLTAIRFEDIEKLGNLYDVVLIEADGAKRKPLKFPASHEPVIPPSSEKIFVVCGLDGLFGRVDEKVFRWEDFCEATGIGEEALITPQVFLRFFSDDVLLKGVNKEKCAVIMNKYDALKSREEAIEMGKKIVGGAGIKEVIVSSVLHKVFYKITRNSL